MANTISGSVVNLRWAEETSPGVLPGSPVFHPVSPNSISSFGSKVSTVAREPITDTRQRQKGTITGVEASVGFEEDVTQNNLLRRMQGLCFADARQKPTTMPLNGTAIDLGAVVGSAHTIAAASGLGSFLANHLVKCSGFGVASNNGLFKVASATATLLTLSSGLADEADAPADAYVAAVGYEFASATLDVTMVGGFPRLNRASGAFDFTTLGLVPGETIYVGGDSAGTSFTNNQGRARVAAVAAGYIDLDKTSWTPQAEVGTGKTVRIFFGTVVKNESTSALVKKKTAQFEMTTGSDANGVMSQYVPGCIWNELSLKVAKKSKVVATFGLVGLDGETRDGSTGVKSGTRPAIVAEECFNTSSDVSGIKLALIDATTAAPTGLVSYLDDLELTIKNNASPSDAIGSVASIDMNAGNFDVGGKATGYFISNGPQTAVRGNSDATLDLFLAKKNAGIALDLPLLGLGDGSLDIKKDAAITVNLETNAYASPKFNHTLCFVHFDYLPAAAEA